MPLVITADNVPSLLLENESLTGFYLWTIPAVGKRLYRIALTTKDSLGKPTETYFFFSHMMDTTVGAPFFLNVPFVRSLFVAKTEATFADLNETFYTSDMLASMKGDKMSGMTFKLAVLNGADTQTLARNAVQVSLLDTYVVGTSSYRFVCYRKMGDYVFYTGLYGDKAFVNEYSTLIPLPSTDKVILEQVVSMVHYYFIRLTATPNVVIANGFPVNSTVVDTYSDAKNNYVLTSSSPNVLQGGTAAFDIAITDKAGGAVVVPKNPVSTNEFITVTSIQPGAHTGFYRVNMGVSPAIPKAPAFLRVFTT